MQSFEYKLQSNRINARFKTAIRFLSICFVFVILAASLTGCVMVGHGEVDDTSKASNFKWCVFDNSDFYLNGNKVDVDIIYLRFFSKESVDGNWPTGARSEENAYIVDGKPDTDLTVKGTSPLRQLAVLMHDSIFDQKYAGVEDDKFLDESKIKALKLNPRELIVSVSQTTADALNKDYEGGGGKFASIFNVLKGAAAAILISMWAMGFISQIVNEKFTMETLLKTLMQLLCGILVITNSTVLVKAFVDTGQFLTDQLSANVDFASFSKLEEEIRGHLSEVSVIEFGTKVIGHASASYGTFVVDLMGPLQAIFLMAAPLFAELLCAYKICSIMIMRLLELTMRITFAPIPLAFSAQSGFSQEATRYLRSTLACAIQPALMLVGCMFVDTITDVVTGIFGTDVSGIWGSLAMCLSYFILNAFFGESKHLAQEIIAR